MRTYAVIQAEIAEFESELARLRQEAKEAQAREVDEARKQIVAIMKEAGMTMQDLLPSPIDKNKLLAPRPPKKEKQTRAAKYQDPDSGKTWSGSGRCPLWLQGKDRDQYLIQQAA